MNFDKIESIAKSYEAVMLYNTPMRDYNTMHVGGNAAALVKPNCLECLSEILTICKSDEIKYFVIGNGSNIIVDDNGLDALVIVLANSFSGIELKNGLIECEAGTQLIAVCNFALNNNLSGLEFAYGIPGTIGGGVYMNAGAYGGEMKDIIYSCDCITENGESKTILAKDMNLSYRHSIFCDSKDIITKVRLKLKSADKSEIKALMDKNIKARKDKQPLEFPSSGSTFKRPDGSYASLLIEQCGLKGKSVGKAQVSEKHSGFVINKGGASCSDILNLINEIQDVVFEKTGYKLECEIKYLKN